VTIVTFIYILVYYNILTLNQTEKNMFAIIPVIILAGGLSVGAFDNSLEDITAYESESTLVQLSAVEIQDNNDRDMYFN